ncbi:MAG: M3 family oligoendopeptidase [Azospirillaceae bacterium]
MTANAIDAPAEALPGWDLSHLYAGPKSGTLTSDLEEAAERSRALEADLKGRLNDQSGEQLGAAIAEYEAISEILGRVMSFAYLHYAEAQGDAERGRFLQAMQEKVTAISAHLLFFTLEINRIEEADLAPKLEAPSLARYQPWLRDVREFRPHQLSDEVERTLLEKSVTGSSAWVRLFDETMADLVFTIDGKAMGSAEALNCLSSTKPELRRAAAKEISRVFTANLRLFTHITNTLAKDKAIEDGWRHFKEPWSSRNLANQVEDEVVDALVDAVRGAYPKLSHRYYRLKAKWFGVDQLDYWDRNAPLPEDVDREIAWPDARRIVLDAYGRFTPQLAEIGRRFFEENWIDAPVRPGKSPGAFSHPTVPSAHPYILLNYQGKVRDVMTLAHELGHGVHQVLAARQGYFLSSTPLTLAETASVFGEMLTFQSLLASETDAKNRKIMLAGKVEDMINTVVRQIAFYTFERKVHAERQEGELSAERLGEIWFEVQRESLGPGIRLGDDYRAWWTYIPHFVHSPFYVYAYAFGDCLVNSLYAVYENADEGFSEKYLEMLKAGGTLRHKELLAPFGLDASDPAFWQKGLAVIEGFIDQLEAEDARTAA